MAEGENTGRSRYGGGPLEGVGGQAVIEGVMMRSPVGAAVAARTPEGEIVARQLDLKLLSESGQIWSRPVFRGAATLVDTLRLGLKALEWSALKQETKNDGDSGDEPGGATGRGSGSAAMSMVLALILAIALFVWLPLQLSRWLLPAAESQILLHLLAGFFRIVFFVGYILVISLVPDVRRVFVYHGAEHQCIHAYEQNGTAVRAADASGESPIHSRCGTSFILLLVLSTVILYAIIDSLVILASGADITPIVRVLYHLPLIPLVVGLSYEALKAVDRHLETSSIARVLSAPGMALQRLTTRRAGGKEVEVAIAALMVALNRDPGDSVAMEKPGGGESPSSGEEEEHS